MISDEQTTSGPSASTPSHHARVYSVPEDDSDDDLYQVEDPVRVSPVLSATRNTKFSVPDSDASDAGSFEDDVEIADTPPSSSGKLMQSTLDLINRPLNTKPQTETNTVTPAQAGLPPRGPSGLTEDEKRDDERTFRAMGLRDPERILVVLDGEEDGSQNHPIPVDYDTIDFRQETPRQGVSRDANPDVTEEPESEEIASESDNPSLFNDCEVDMDDMDEMDDMDDTDGFYEDMEQALGDEAEEVVEAESPQLEPEVAEDEMSAVDLDLSSDDEEEEEVRHRSPSSPSMSPSLSPTPYSPAEDFETDEEASEADSWEERDQSLSPSPPPAQQNVGNGTSTGSVPAPPLAAKLATAGYYRTNYDNPTNSNQQNLTFTSPMRAPSPSDAAMAKPIVPNKPATSPWGFNTFNALRPPAPPTYPHSTYQTSYSGFAHGCLSVPTHPPTLWQPAHGYSDGPFSMGNHEIAAMDNYQGVGNAYENGTFHGAEANTPKFEQNPRSSNMDTSQPPHRPYQLFQAIPPTRKDDVEEASNRLQTSLDRIRRLKELREKSVKETRKAFDAAQESSKAGPKVVAISNEKEWLDLPSQAAAPPQPQPSILVAKKMSIDDIVEKQPTGPDSSASPNKLKRKADSMSTSTNCETMEDALSKADEDFTCSLNQSQVLLAKQQAEREMAAQQLAQLKDSGASLSSEVAVAPITESVVVEAIEQTEPPAKRVKTTNATGSSNLARYAATAVGGVILGGIGAVAALISLPPEFFA